MYYLAIEPNFNDMKVTICRKERFNSAHRLFNPKWDFDKNQEVYGACNNPNFHGHNYDLIVKVTGEIDPDTGYVMNLKDLKEIILDKVIERFDHRNLNLDTEEFKNLIPTAENIAVVIWNILRVEIHAHHQLEITLYETERNFVEYSGT